MARYRLISYDLCPFVQRTQVILREKSVDFDVDYVDLSSKPDWFPALSPTGKVPTLEVTTAVGAGGPSGTLPRDDRPRSRRLP